MASDPTPEEVERWRGVLEDMLEVHWRADDGIVADAFRFALTALDRVATLGLERDAARERAQELAHEMEACLGAERHENRGLREQLDAVSARAERAEAEAGHLRAALEHIRHVCRIGASPEWACRAAREEAEAALGERGAREEPSGGV